MTEVSLDVNAREDLMKAQHRLLGWIQLWAGAMLGVLYLWLSRKFDDIPQFLPLLVLILAGAAVTGGLLNAFLKVPGGSPLGRIQQVEMRTRIVAMQFLTGGLFLTGLALFVGLRNWPERLGELLNIGFLGLMGLWFGFSWLRTKPIELSQGFLARIGELRIAFGIILMGFGLVLAGFAVGMRLRELGEMPEIAGLFLSGVFYFFLGLWMCLLAAESWTSTTSRVFLLLFGGGTGLILCLGVLMRAWTSFDDLFLGGIPAWTGPRSWRLWLLIYLLLAGLLLMFVSSLAIRGEVRNHASLRRTYFGYNAVLHGLLLFLFLAVLDIVIYAAFPLSYNWTASQGLHAISQSSKNLLAKLKEQVQVYVLMSPKEYGYLDMKNLLDNSRSISDKVRVHYIDPTRDFQSYQELAVRYPEVLPAADARFQLQEQDLGRGVLLVFGPEGKDANPQRVLVPLRKIRELPEQGNPGAPRKISFKGEEALFSELLHHTQGQKKTRIAFLQGNGELDIRSQKILQYRRPPFEPLTPFGAKMLADKLEKDNFEVKGLFFDSPVEGKADGNDLYVTGKDLPPGIDVIIVAGPSKEIPKDGLDALDRYLEKGGRMIALFDLVTDRNLTKYVETGLEKLLRKYNVDVPNEYLFGRPIDATFPAGSTQLSQQFRGQQMLFLMARPIRALSSGSPNFKAEPLMVVEPQPPYAFWPESNLEGLRNQQEFVRRFNVAEKMARKPVPVAVTVTEGKEKGRLVVFGDADFINNLGMVLQAEDVNYGDVAYNLIANSIDWLVERPTLGIRAKETDRYSLPPGTRMDQLVWLPFLVMVLFLVGMGCGLWIIRRR